MSSPELIHALAYYVVFVFSATLHEAAHAWAAKRGGDLTAYHGGQVSIDPLPHIRREPIGMVVLPLISLIASGWPIGFASAPYDPYWADRHPKRAALMALAGPAANLLVVVVVGLLLNLGFHLGVFFAPDTIHFGEIAGSDTSGLWAGAAFLLGALFCQNLLLFVFNMLPLPPLDGSGAMPLLLSEKSAAVYRQFISLNPSIAWMGLFFAWQVFGTLYHPIFLKAVSMLYPEVDYI
jgi:Zn-dependent protease